MIEPQPQTPTVVIKSQRKRDADDEQNRQYCLVAGVGEEQANNVNNQNQEFSCYYVGHDRANEKSFLALENYAARPAKRFHVKEPLNN